MKTLIMNQENILSDFFSAYSLSEIRSNLNNLLFIALTSDNDHYEMPDERYIIASFVEQLHKLLEATYTLAPKKLKKS